MRWLVGDIQGCARELDDLLRAVRFDAARDELWCLGDLVNRGPDSLATLRLWRDVGGRAVLGNHDIYALLVHAGRVERRNDTLGELLTASDGAELLARLRAQPLLQRLEGTGKVPLVWAVHAGLDPRWYVGAADVDGAVARVGERLADGPHPDERLDSPDAQFVTRVRCCTAAGERSRFDRLPGDCPPPHRPWDAWWSGPAYVAHGHWAWRGHYRGAATIGLDSGCVYGGTLTAWTPDEDRVVQVPARSA
jgi:bis(5'-nucleosyl)-tetraphosphatase (symmetrical)